VLPYASEAIGLGLVKTRFVVLLSVNFCQRS
jgi:hypothetical protein